MAEPSLLVLKRRRLRVRPGVISEDRVYFELKRVLGRSWPIRFYADRRSHILFLDTRWILVDTRYFPCAIAEVIEQVTGRPYSQVLYEMGRRMGEITADHYIEREITGENLLLITAAIAARTGWGLYYPFEINSDSFRVIGYNSFESDSFVFNRINTWAPTCALTSGFLAGIMGRYFGAPCEVKEVRCRSKGDPYCLFEGRVG